MRILNTQGATGPDSLFALVSLAGCLAASAGAAVVTVDGRTNILTAGYPDISAFTTANVWDPGVLATVSVGVWGGATVNFNSVTMAGARGGSPLWGPDGYDIVAAGDYYQVNVHAPLTSISGIRANRDGFFAGVFLADGVPSGAAPAALDFRNVDRGGMGPNFSALSPLLNQVFFIGDGRTDLSQLQDFVAPAGATRLFLGSLDAWYTATGCCWGDNTWDFTADVSVVPAPGAAALIAAAGLVGMRRRR